MVARDHTRGQRSRDESHGDEETLRVDQRGVTPAQTKDSAQVGGVAGRDARRRHDIMNIGFTQEPIWIQQERLRIPAQRAVQFAIDCGDLIRPDRCECCGQAAYTYAHHEDYREPLTVEFLCSRCHQLRHKRGEWLARLARKQPKRPRADDLVAFYRKQFLGRFGSTTADDMAEAMKRARS